MKSQNLNIIAMIRHYKTVLFCAGIFLIVGVSPSQEPIQLQTKIKPTPVPIIPVDLSEVEKSDRELWEALKEYQWMVSQEVGKR